MVVESATDTKKMKYPKSIFFIVSNEFCERFSYYGMRTILTLYLKNQLMYSSNTSTVIYHVFSMMVYFFPLFGAMLADSLLGKFRTIFYLSIVYAIGQILLSLSAAPPLGLPSRECSLLSLLLIAIGTGGIKPCVAAFGGDQFMLPQQERYLSTFFSLFYFSINSGSLISSFLMPIIRNDIACFGENTCYSLAFFVPAVLMILSIILFIFGKPLYKIVKPTGNVVLNVSKCISHAIYKKITSKNVKKDYWLDYADDKYDKLLINDIKAALQVMILFIPIPIFWALFDQQGSRWTFQATRMNGEIGNFLLQPDQMQVFNPFLVLAFIPLFETCLYPIMMKFGFRTPLRIMVIGGFLAALSFVIAAIVEFQLESTYPVLPSKDFAQLRIFNTLNCSIEGKLRDENELSQELSFIVKSMDMWENKYIKANGQKNFSYEVNFKTCNEAGITNISSNKINGSIFVIEAEANSWIITPEGFVDYYKDSIDKSRTGDPLVRGLIFVNTLKSISLELMKDGTSFLKLMMNGTFDKNEELNSIKPNIYDIHLNGKKVQSNIPFKLGGVYTIVGSVIENKTNAAMVTVTDPNSVHILWLIPQYVIITMSEVMFSVTGLEFAFTQAPSSMKSLLQACWLLTVAFGNLIVVIVAEVSIFNRQAYEFLLFAGLMFIDVIIFAVMAKLYKYVNTPENEEITENIQMDEKDGIVMTNEIISGIQAIKMYTWEKPFSKLIERARRREINIIRYMSFIRGITMSFIMFTTRMSLFITILAYILYGHKITAEKVFMLQAYYNILRLTMTVYFPQGVTQIAELLVSIKRLQKFMLYEELEETSKKTEECKNERSKDDQNDVNKVEKDTNDVKSTDVETNNQTEYILSLRNANCKWLVHDQEDTLKNININVKSGELIAVVGQVGSGKSSLLNVILKELPLNSGIIEINGRITYASQEPWLFAGSVRQNILFGRKFDQYRYDRVIKVCQLKRDFTLLPYGDKTIVGERGISLSGGQRARINLARAVYSETEIYLLDDPLSAVDAHVGKHMFEECIVKYLKGKTRILVTHQLQYLQAVDRIIVLKDGAIEAEGSYEKLASMGMDFGRLLEKESEEEEQQRSSNPPSRTTSRHASVTSLSSIKSNTSEKNDPVEIAEMQSKGKVSGEVYAKYFRAGGNWCLVATIAIFCVLAQGLASGSDFFISEWVNMEEKYVNETNNEVEINWKGPLSREYCIYLYTGLVISTVIITFIRSFTFFTTCMKASIRLHDRMFQSLSQARMRFFNTNTSGRVLNRFSKDMGAIDEVLPIALIDCIQIGLSLLGIVAVVGVANYWLLIPTVIIGIVFYYLRVFYLATSRSVKRLDGVTRSPVFVKIGDFGLAKFFWFT